MRSKRTVVATCLAIALSLGAGGCARVVVNYHDALKDGGKLEFPLKSGRYELEMTAGGDGASIEWRGCDCRGTGPVKHWKRNCRLPSGGTLVVRNPSLLHLGSDSRVDLKITKLP